MRTGFSKPWSVYIYRKVHEWPGRPIRHYHEALASGASSRTYQATLQGFGMPDINCIEANSGVIHIEREKSRVQVQALFLEILSDWNMCRALDSPVVG